MGSSNSIMKYAESLDITNNSIISLKITNINTAVDESVTKLPILHLRYTAVLKSEYSNYNDMETLTTKAKEFNSSHEIYGTLTVTNPMSDEWIIEQVLEGDLSFVMNLFEKIKTDNRIKMFVGTTYSIRTLRKYTQWGLVYTYTNHFDASIGFCADFMSTHVKHSMISHTNDTNVFIIEDLHTQQLGILKELMKTSEAETIQNLTKEFRILSYIHSNGYKNGICHIPDIFHEFDRINMVYPMYQLNVRDILSSYNSDIPIRIICIYSYQLLVILETLEKVKIVHRDINVENVRIDDSGNMILIDFEKAIHCKHSSNKYGTSGASIYHAPEVLDYGCSYKSDLWSVGILILELCGCHDSQNLTGVYHRPDRVPVCVWNVLERIFRPVCERVEVTKLLDDIWFAGLDRTTIWSYLPQLNNIRNISSEKGIRVRGLIKKPQA